MVSLNSHCQAACQHTAGNVQSFWCIITNIYKRNRKLVIFDRHVICRNWNSTMVTVARAGRHMQEATESWREMKNGRQRIPLYCFWEIVCQEGAVVNSWCCHWAEDKTPSPCWEQKPVPTAGCTGIEGSAPPPVFDFVGFAHVWVRFVRHVVLKSVRESLWTIPIHFTMLLNRFMIFFGLNAFVYSLTTPTSCLSLFSVFFRCWCLADRLFQWYPLQAPHTLDIFHYLVIPFKL